MTDPQTTGAVVSDFFAHLPKPLALPTPEETYDAIMGQIDPELTTSKLPLLDEKYKTETQEQTLARKEKYVRSFQAYDEKFREYRREIEQRSQSYQRSVMAANESLQRGSESAQMSAIETEFSS
jgi:hypothetical protein